MEQHVSWLTQFVNHYMGAIDGSFRSWGLARGGTGAISNAIAKAAREAGAQIRTEAPVAGIRIKHGRAIGVTLATGDELDADVVLSSVDPRLTFLQFVGARELPSEFVDDVRRYRFRGSSGKVNLALDALPDFTCRPGPGPHLRGAISISPSMEYRSYVCQRERYLEEMKKAQEDQEVARKELERALHLLELNHARPATGVVPAAPHRLDPRGDSLLRHGVALVYRCTAA